MQGEPLERHEHVTMTVFALGMLGLMPPSTPT